MLQVVTGDRIGCHGLFLWSSLQAATGGWCKLLQAALVCRLLQSADCYRLPRKSCYRLLQTYFYKLPSFPLPAQDVTYLHNELERRVAARQATLNLDFAERFVRKATMKASVDVPWVITWVISVSDITTERIAAAMKVDEDAPWQLLVMATQFPWLSAPMDELLIRAVLKSVLDSLNDRHGKRLQNFQRDGGILANGKIDWAKGVYKPVFVEGPAGKLKEIVHISGAKKVIATGSVDKAYSLRNNFLDMGACFVADDMPKVPLHLQFKKSLTGPYAVLPMKAGSQAWLTLIQEHADLWKAKKAEAKGAPRDTDLKAAEKAFTENAAAKKSVKRKDMDGKASELFKKKVAKRTVSFN